MSAGFAERARPEKFDPRAGHGVGFEKFKRSGRVARVAGRLRAVRAGDGLSFNTCPQLSFKQNTEEKSGGVFW